MKRTVTRGIVNLSRAGVGSVPVAINNENGATVTVNLNAHNTYFDRDSACGITQSVNGNGNAVAGYGASATVQTTGQIQPLGQFHGILSQIEREFTEGMRKYGRISAWSECFAILEREKDRLENISNCG